MEEKRDRVIVKHGLKLLLVKVILGGVAAAAAILLMRIVGSREVLVALFIGLVPGIAERSLKVFLFGAVFAVIGFFIGGSISAAIAKKAIQEVPLGHWAIVGGFIGMTAGISRRPGQWFSFRFVIWSLGAAYGFVLGLIFGFLGDIGGFFAIRADNLPFFYYYKEVSFIFAGVFINLVVALASIITASLDNGLWRVARAVEGREA